MIFDKGNKYLAHMSVLPPANEIWGKVIFSRSVCKSFCSEGGSLYDVTSCLVPGPMFLQSSGGLCPWSHVPSGQSLSGGSLSRGSL